MGMPKSVEKHYYTMGQSTFEVDTKYVPIKPIGKGSYGVVCSSINRETGEKVAIKKIQNVFDNHIDAKRALRELTILRQTKHENVITLKDVMMPKYPRSFDDLYLVYELMDTDLHHIIQSSQPLLPDHCKYLMLQLLCGINYLHSVNVLHRDLKPGNLLINADCELKICDFGLARTSGGTDELMTEYIVTRWYRAPELLLGCFNYGTSIDMWSVGCIFAEILGRKPIFQGADSVSQIKLIIDVLGSQNETHLAFIINTHYAKNFVTSLPFTVRKPFATLYPDADPLAIDLLQRMLAFDPRKRIGAAEALRHPYFAGVYDSCHDSPAQYPHVVDNDEDVGKEVIREMVLMEVLYYHSDYLM